MLDIGTFNDILLAKSILTTGSCFATIVFGLHMFNFRALQYNTVLAKKNISPNNVFSDDTFNKNSNTPGSLDWQGALHVSC